MTEFRGSLQVLPQHPAYAFEGDNAAASIRQRLPGGAEGQKRLGFQDTEKGVQKIYELSELPNPPLRLLLGKDVNHFVRQYIAQLTQEADAYETWSDNLTFKGN